MTGRIDMLRIKRQALEGCGRRKEVIDVDREINAAIERLHPENQEIERKRQA